MRKSLFYSISLRTATILPPRRACHSYIKKRR